MIRIIFSIKLSLICLLSSTFAASTPAEFPAEWWKPVDVSTAPSWEVLPHQAKEGEVVLSKRNELGLLSNFSHTPFNFEGKTYQSVEGLWQSMKYPENKEDIRMTWVGAEWKFKRDIVEQMIAFDAKKAGSLASKNMKKQNENWVSYKGKKMTYKTSEKGEHYNLIKKIMWAKILQNPKIKKILLKTKNLKLIPDHKVKADAPPAWLYNVIWMEIRSKLQASKNNF